MRHCNVGYWQSYMPHSATVMGAKAPCRAEGTAVVQATNQVVAL